MSVTLYVWKISPTNVGHVAVQVDDTYMSYWPSEAAGKNDVKLGDTHDVMFPRSYAHDRKLELKPAEELFELSSVDGTRVTQAWTSFVEARRRLFMVDHNCSTVIASLLEIGSGIEPSFVPGVLIDNYARGTAQRMFLRVRFFSKRIRMWTPDDVLRYANEIESQAPHK